MEVVSIYPGFESSNQANPSANTMNPFVKSQTEGIINPQSNGDNGAFSKANNPSGPFGIANKQNTPNFFNTGNTGLGILTF